MCMCICYKFHIPPDFYTNCFVAHSHKRIKMFDDFRALLGCILCCWLMPCYWFQYSYEFMLLQMVGESSGERFGPNKWVNDLVIAPEYEIVASPVTGIWAVYSLYCWPVEVPVTHSLCYSLKTNSRIKTMSWQRLHHKSKKLRRSTTRACKWLLSGTDYRVTNKMR